MDFSLSPEQEAPFITNGPICDVFTVVAVTDADAGPGQGMTAFILEKGMPGIVECTTKSAEDGIPDPRRLGLREGLPGRAGLA